jgi:hypothetical protein
MKRTIFYIWQSDLPPTANRNFIQRALEDAAKAIITDGTPDIEPVIDRDTAGVPGSPDITKTIFQKIADADVVVADVSIINTRHGGRQTPNPNVLVELGFALHAIGDERVILVFNTAYGKVEDLPFDLRPRRVTKYYMSENAADRSGERKVLQRAFETALRAILPGVRSDQRKELVEIFGKGAGPGPILISGSEASRQPGTLALSRLVTVVNKAQQPVRITAKRLLVDGNEWVLEDLFFQNLKSRSKDRSITIVGNSHEDLKLYFLVSTTNLPRDRAGIVELQIDADEEPLRVNVQFPSL